MCGCKATMRILQVVLGIGAVLVSISAWHVGYGMTFWNLSHTVTFSIIPMMGMWMLWKSYEDASESL